jgi:hypothetical protein
MHKANVLAAADDFFPAANEVRNRLKSRRLFQRAECLPFTADTSHNDILRNQQLRSRQD